MEPVSWALGAVMLVFFIATPIWAYRFFHQNPLHIAICWLIADVVATVVVIWAWAVGSGTDAAWFRTLSEYGSLYPQSIVFTYGFTAAAWLMLFIRAELPRSAYTEVTKLGWLYQLLSMTASLGLALAAAYQTTLASPGIHTAGAALFMVPSALYCCLFSAHADVIKYGFPYRCKCAWVRFGVTVCLVVALLLTGIFLLVSTSPTTDGPTEDGWVVGAVAEWSQILFYLIWFASHATNDVQETEYSVAYDKTKLG